MLDRMRPLFASLNSRQVDYLVIGGVAAIAYGVPRLTLDLDLLIRPTHDNAASLLASFLDTGLGTAALITADDLLAHEITVFKDRLRVDVQTRTPGLDFDSAWSRRNTIELEGCPVHLVAYEDLIASKKASGRARDLDDVRMLEGSRKA